MAFRGGKKTSFDRKMWPPHKPWKVPEGRKWSEEGLRAHLKEIKLNPVFMKTARELAQEVVDGSTSLEEIEARPEVSPKLYRATRLEWIKMTRQAKYDEDEPAGMEERLEGAVPGAPKRRGRRKWTPEQRAAQMDARTEGGASREDEKPQETWQCDG